MLVYLHLRVHKFLRWAYPYSLILMPWLCRLGLLSRIFRKDYVQANLITKYLQNEWIIFNIYRVHVHWNLCTVKDWTLNSTEEAGFCRCRTDWDVVGSASCVGVLFTLISCSPSPRDAAAGSAAWWRPSAGRCAAPAPRRSAARTRPAATRVRTPASEDEDRRWRNTRGTLHVHVSGRKWSYLRKPDVLTVVLDFFSCERVQLVLFSRIPMSRFKETQVRNMNSKCKKCFKCSRQNMNIQEKKW